MLTLTDQVEAHQKLEETLKKQIAEAQEDIERGEADKSSLLEKIKERDLTLEEMESLKSQADEENLKL